jgi:hypothetical protein
MKIRDLDMPSQSKLDTLSLFLVDFYLKNIITTSRLKKIFDIYYKFKQKFLEKYPGRILIKLFECPSQRNT